jgi:hypothetical protein
MKFPTFALASIVGASSLLGVALIACSDSDGVNQTTDASVDSSSSQATVDDENRIPCAPRAVLQTVCQQCHTRPTKNGAPFPLQRLSDIMQTRDGELIRDDMIAQLESGRMPLSPVTISATDKATLLTWLHSGAPATEATDCTGDAGSDASTPDAGSDGGTDAGNDSAGW